jgi:hypothetical protein
MRINTKDYRIEWNGSHTANVYPKNGMEIDCFTFAWDKDKVPATDFVSAAIAYLEN